MTLNVIFDLKRIVCLLFIGFSTAGSVAAQKCRPPSFDTDLSVIGAVDTVVRGVQPFRRFRGIAPVERGLPSTIEIYEVTEKDLDFDLFSEKIPFKAYRKIITDEKGKFCMDDLPYGEYLLKFGTAQGARVIVMQISLTKDGSKKGILK